MVAKDSISRETTEFRTKKKVEEANCRTQTIGHTTLPTLEYSSFDTRSTCAPTNLSTKRFPVKPGSLSKRACNA